MRRRLAIGAAILAITLLNYFQFPGHSWLQSDTQIYLPILEHIWDPDVLAKDLIVEHPHVAFTLYDETAIVLRKITRLEFRQVLQAEQFVFRALGIWGVYLIATALGVSDILALFVVAAFSLGATIMGPAVLTFEYEPVPRGFALPLFFLAIGLGARERYLWAGIAASVAFLIHAPTIAPFWFLYFLLMLWPGEPSFRRRRLNALWPLAIALLVLFVVSLVEPANGEHQALLARLDPQQMQLQRMRAGYNWISLWWRQWIWHYLILFAVIVLAYRRLRKDFSHSLRLFLIALPLLGVLSLPISYLLLENLHWALLPQIQPARLLLFDPAFAVILGAVAACKAVGQKRCIEAFLWLLPVYLIPANREITWPSWNRVMVVAALALLALFAVWAAQSLRRWAWAAMTAAILVPFFLIPGYGKMRNYPPLHNPDLDQLADWARASTPTSAVFLFPDAEQDLYPGVFRVEAQRAVYVDWKTGGQVNFFKSLGEEWWSRWKNTMEAPFDPNHLERYRDSGIDYIVLQRKNRLAGARAVYENSAFDVYPLTSAPPR
ncbi:MAG: hypothetical protein DMG57_06485 [Acidobacteria bacterium]|nr:MAG: hypothetical protein DMG57_06485 [Acidobacteriota bacterium]